MTLPSVTWPSPPIATRSPRRTETIVVPWNDAAAVEAAAREHELAAILAEPYPANMGLVPPEPGFLEHLRRFGHSDPASPVEVVSFAVTATGLIDTPELPRPPQGEREPPGAARRGTRRAFFETAGAGWVECPVWQREALLAGNRVAGPAIVEEVSATTVLYPGDVARVDAIGSLVVEIGG